MINASEIMRLQLARSLGLDKYCSGKTSASRWFAESMSAAEIEE